MQARCATRFRDVGAAVVSPTEWLAYLNDAYTDVVAASPFWPFLETRNTSAVTVLANTRSIALPTNVTRVTAARNTRDNVKLEQLDGKAQHLLWDPTQAQTGIPVLYRVLGTKFELYPMPSADTIIELEYPLPPALLVSAGDIPVFPSQYHRALVEGALCLAYADDGAVDQTQLHQARFDAILSRMMNDLLGADRHERAAGIADDWWE